MDSSEIDPTEYYRRVKERVSIVRGFMLHPGYELFQEMIRLVEEASYNALMSSKDAHEMAKNAGAHRATKDLRSWAERELAHADMILKQAALDKSDT